MRFLANAYQEGAAAALEKFAARRGLLEIRNAISQGNMGRANQLATTPGVLKPAAINPMGSQLRHLGAGGEGAAALVAHPEYGVSVRKMFSPSGRTFSPDMIQRKEQLNGLPGTAGIVATAQTGRGTPVHFNEYVPGQTVTPQLLQQNPAAASAYQSALLQSHRSARAQGFHLQDTRMDNAVLTPQGQVKLIDYMPFRGNELAANGLSRHLRKSDGAHTIATTDEGRALFGQRNGFPTRLNARKNLSGFYQHMFGGSLGSGGPGRVTSLAPETAVQTRRAASRTTDPGAVTT